ncbi:hypothetical protein [Actinomadura atramentaria]|uniref:hypothetical protein n=1 Tax=Actinomadura atramentaria TaxID=1990 RepID=UPI00037E655F|nr:hypothetical protein [Actinomadura atramentaria]
MIQYDSIEDRKILQARGTRVVEVDAAPSFRLLLTDGLKLEYDGEVTYKLGGESIRSARPLSTLPPEQVNRLVAARPLSWVVFNTGDQRIVFSNAWYLYLSVDSGQSWRLDLGDGVTLTHPPT